MSPAGRQDVERVYAALAPQQLRDAVAAGALPEDTPVHAVTPALRAQEAAGSDGDVDVEELELAALLDAAASSLRLVAAGGGPARRLVLAADVPRTALRPWTAAGDDPAEARSRVSPSAPLPLRAVVSAHVDEREAAADVAAAAGALAAADAGDDAAAALLEAADERDLLWYDATELGELAEELAAGLS